MDSVSLKVSYPIVKVGQNIIVFKIVGIPGLNYTQPPTGGEKADCREESSIGFLNKNLLHTEVYLTFEGTESYSPYSTTWRLLTPTPNGEDTMDVAAFIIQNGYGSTAFHIPAYSAQKSKGEFFKYPGAGFLLVGYARNLQDEQEVARLAKRGFWGACQ